MEIFEMKTLTVGGNTFEIVDEKARKEFVEMRKRIEDLEFPTLPILVGGNAWYKSSVDKKTITKVSITADYTPTGTEDETWNADDGNTGSIKCYRTGTEIAVVPVTARRIRMNANSQQLFENFKEVKAISGLDLLDSRDVTTLYRAFLYCEKLKEVDAPTWRLHKCTNTNAFAAMCYLLEKLDIGVGLPTVGIQFAKLCGNLRLVSGVDSVSALGRESFHCCYNVRSIDLRAEKITSIGDNACFLSPIEDYVDLSVVPIANVGKWATRSARWDAEQLDEFKSMPYPNDIFIDVPYPDSQNRYGNVPYCGSKSVQTAGCVSLAVYHAWNAKYAGTANVFTSWKDWWDTYFNADGNYAATHSSVPSATTVLTTLGWGLTMQYCNTANNFWSMFTSLKNGKPVYISREITGTDDHASLVVGVKNGKLLVLDSAGHDDPVVPVTYEIRIEDVFIQNSADNDDYYGIIDYGD